MWCRLNSGSFCVMLLTDRQVFFTVSDLCLCLDGAKKNGNSSILNGSPFRIRWPHFTDVLCLCAVLLYVNREWLWFDCAVLHVWEAHRAKMVFLCFRSSFTVGYLSALIGPDGPSLCLSDLSTVTVLSSVYIPSWPTSQQDRWQKCCEFEK